MRPVKSVSDVESMQSAPASAGFTNGPPHKSPLSLHRTSLPLYRSGYRHKTHGSNNALNALASSPSPSSHQLSALAQCPSPSTQHPLPIHTSSPSSIPDCGLGSCDDSSVQFSSSAPLPSWGFLDPQDSDHSWQQHFASQGKKHCHSKHSQARQGHYVVESLGLGDGERSLSGSPISPLGSRWPTNRHMHDAAHGSSR